MHGVSQIRVGITQETTFEKDIIFFNKTGKGRDILLQVIKDVRPIAGKAFERRIGQQDLVVNDFFELVKEYKSEFAYSLMLALEENSEGFSIPAYIVDGIKFLA